MERRATGEMAMNYLILKFAASLFLGLVMGGGICNAQSYPSKPITLVVPFAAGGPTDIVTRIVAELMSRELGQPLVVENVGGAGGMIGASRVARANPDGHVLLLTN